MQHIVCFDPRQKSVPGTIVKDTQVARLNAAGVALLEVNHARIFQSSCDSFAQRFCGSDGWVYNNNQVTRGLHLLLRLSEPDRYALHWVARLEPIEAGPMSGKLKLISDGSRNQLSGGLQPKVRIDNIPSKTDRYGGLSVSGVSDYNTSIEGIMGLCLHGVMNNVKVLSLSVSAVTVAS